MAVLRIAEEKDFEVVKVLAKKFFEESPYKDFPMLEERFDEYVKSFLTASVAKMILLAEDQEKPIGFLAFELSDWLFAPFPVAVEKAMWVEADHRESDVAKELLGAFFFWALKIGCPLIQLSSLTGEYEKKLDKFYKKMKFKKVENIYLKQLGK